MKGVQVTCHTRLGSPKWTHMNGTADGHFIAWRPAMTVQQNINRYTANCREWWQLLTAVSIWDTSFIQN